jgi:hypothetical protein
LILKKKRDIWLGNINGEHTGEPQLFQWNDLNYYG